MTRCKNTTIDASHPGTEQNPRAAFICSRQSFRQDICSHAGREGRGCIVGPPNSGAVIIAITRNCAVSQCVGRECGQSILNWILTPIEKHCWIAAAFAVCSVPLAEKVKLVLVVINKVFFHLNLPR